MSVMTAEPPIPPAPESGTIPLRLSYEDFLDWLDEDKHAEWVDGEIIMHSPVSFRHNKVGNFLIAIMQTFAEDHGLGDIADDPFQMKTGPNLPSRVPDILFIAKTNKHRIKKNLLEGPADLVVEIISPESRGRDRGDKFYEYEEGGVREYWLLDPERRIAEFYLLGADGRYRLAGLDAEGRFHSVVLAGFWLSVDWLWQDPLPTLRDVLKAWES